ncbi:MAG: hypothetical protein JW739_02345 [Opitutales bacterium]|nr:hypothetical protein [Opitutales bacterium]
MNKKSFFRIISATVVALSSLAFSGCDTVPEDNPMSWSQPASWENQIPGMSGMGSGTSDAPDY